MEYSGKHISDKRMEEPRDKLKHMEYAERHILNECTEETLDKLKHVECSGRQILDECTEETLNRLKHAECSGRQILDECTEETLDRLKHAECSGKHILNECTEETLDKLKHVECSGRQILDERTEETLYKLKLDALDRNIYKKVLENWDSIAKPLDGMGRFETVTAQIGAVLGTDKIDISKKAVIIMCADNGIVEEGISQSGQEVTAAVAAQMGQGTSSVGKMAAAAGADTIPVDIGINGNAQIKGVLDRKVRCGTRNFRKEPAMTREEAVRAIFTGIEIAGECKRNGYQILATGEMGIGNTTTSSAAAAALLRCGTDEVTGRGAGLCDEKLQHKKQIIAEAVRKYSLYEAEPLTVLETVGGLDLAGLAGVCIGGGVFHIPVVLDGMISMTAALLAERIVPGTMQYLIPSHKGKELAVEKLMKALNLEPVIDAGMALGEGTGAVMMLSLLEMALCVYRRGALFSDIQVEQYERY